MNKADAVSNSRASAAAPPPQEAAADHYHGVDLAPTVLESLVTWDVSGHAQRERDRLSSAHRAPAAVGGGY